MASCKLNECLSRFLANGELGFRPACARMLAGSRKYRNFLRTDSCCPNAKRAGGAGVQTEQEYKRRRWKSVNSGMFIRQQSVWTQGPSGCTRALSCGRDTFVGRERPERECDRCRRKTSQPLNWTRFGTRKKKRPSLKGLGRKFEQPSPEVRSHLPYLVSKNWKLSFLAGKSERRPDIGVAQQREISCATGRTKNRPWDLGQPTIVSSRSHSLESSLSGRSTGVCSRLHKFEHVLSDLWKSRTGALMEELIQRQDVLNPQK
jgi:hypothetical protein